MSTKPQLCGSFLHFYACFHRADRGGRATTSEKRGALDVLPCSPGYTPGTPYRCLAPPEVHQACPAADLDGRKHRAARIHVELKR